MQRHQDSRFSTESPFNIGTKSNQHLYKSQRQPAHPPNLASITMRSDGRLRWIEGRLLLMTMKLHRGWGGGGTSVNSATRTFQSTERWYIY